MSSKRTKKILHRFPSTCAGHEMMMMVLLRALVALLVSPFLLGMTTCKCTVSAAEFNFEISLRVREKLTQYMNDPITIARIISEFRANGGFPHDMAAPDRNAYMRLNDALLSQYPHFESIYYGLEDGVFVGHGFASRYVVGSFWPMLTLSLLTYIYPSPLDV